jgi:hypothetical protein
VGAELVEVQFDFLPMVLLLVVIPSVSVAQLRVIWLRRSLLRRNETAGVATLMAFGMSFGVPAIRDGEKYSTK